MVAFPPCKINLGLSIVQKRGDGYHDIETCFYPLPFTDILEIIPAESIQFSSSGLTIPGNEEDNICLKAYALLDKDFRLPPVKIHLHKIIPTGAGLGGGSSDGAHTLRLLNTLFGLNLREGKLMHYASLLGSDCSFFIQDRSMMGSGRGEILKDAEVNLQGKYLILLHPGLHVSTAEAYAGVIPGAAIFPIESTLTKALDQWKILLQNDFEKSVFERFPLIATLKDELYKSGALYASLSGSGSAVFGIFDMKTEIAGSPVAPYVIWQGYLPVL